MIESLEAVHIQLLPDVHGESQKDPQPLEDGSQGRRGVRPDALEGLTSLHPDILAAVLNDLAAKQLIWNAWERTYAGLRGVVAYVLTDLGEQVRRLLDAAAEEQDPAATAP